LADDIEHWLADEPVSACREPWTARARRWLKRHKAVAAAAVAAGLEQRLIHTATINHTDGNYHMTCRL
jgi:hypothetical protein